MIPKRATGLVLFILLPILIVCIYLILLHTLYLTSFDRAYLNELYDHSQYSIAQSIRQIGDLHVYQVIGDRLVRGAGNVFTIDPQVPPLGKTLMGWSINLLGNAYLLNIMVGLLVGYGAGLLTYTLTRSIRWGLVGMLTVLMDPLIVSQFKQTMLDMPLLVLLLYHAICLILLTRSSVSWVRIALTLISGSLLGLAASVKFGILIPLYALVGAFVIVYQWRRWSQGDVSTLHIVLKILSILIVYMLSIGAGFAISHAQFFLTGGTLIQFLKNEKWVVEFWLTSDIKARIGMPIISLLTGFYRHFTKTAPWEWLWEWSPLWVLGVSVIVVRIQHFIRSKVPLWIVAAHFAVGFTPYLVTPFYYRYMVTSVPFLMLVAVFLLSHVPLTHTVRNLLIVGILIVTAIKSMFMLYDQPNAFMSGVKTHLEKKVFQDLYSGIDPHSLNGEKRYDFWKRLYGQLHSAGVSKVRMSVADMPFVMPWDRELFAPYTLTYDTTIGSMTTNGSLHVRRIGHEWKLVWDDSYLWPGYTKSSRLELILDKHVGYGVLRNGRDGGIIAPVETPVIDIYPSRISDEQLVLRTTTRLTGLNKYSVENAYKSNHPRDLPAYIGSVLPRYRSTLDPSQLPEGMQVRYEDIYPSTLGRYSAIVPQIGGRIVLHNGGRRETILSMPSRDGIDMVTNESDH